MNTTARYVAHIIKFLGGDPSALMQLMVSVSSKKVFARIIECPTYPTAMRTPDLPGAIEALDAALESGESPSELFARLFEATYSIRQRKNRGQFFTPLRAAIFALDAASDLSSLVMLDAGAGTGVFGEAVMAGTSPCRSYVGVESDPLLALMAANTLHRKDASGEFKVWYTNFLTISQANVRRQKLHVPTLIVSNPPYVRFHNLNQRGRRYAGARGDSRVHLSALSGSANYFIRQGIELLDGETEHAPLARGMVFVMPKEATGSAHYRQLRENLRSDRGWHASRYDIPTDFLNGGTGAIAQVFVFRSGPKGPDVSEPAVRQAVDRYALSDFMAVRRGLSTGKNSFFVLTDAEARLRRIPDTYLREVLPTRITFQAACFSRENWVTLRDSGHPCWVLHIPVERTLDELDPAVRAYLKEGMQQGLHATATARRLRRWYALPVPPDPPLMFVTYFFRGAPRFILNEAGVTHLTNILGVRPRREWRDDVDKRELMRSLNNDALAWFADGHPGREYRDGLRKIEPKELERLPLSKHTMRLVGGLLVDKEPSLFET